MPIVAYKGWVKFMRYRSFEKGRQTIFIGFQKNDALWVRHKVFLFFTPIK